MGYFDYTKEKDFLICIDSDGCAMDTMNSKHFNSFGPEFVKSYDLEEYKEEALEYWTSASVRVVMRLTEPCLLTCAREVRVSVSARWGTRSNFSLYI